ncbi:MAG: glycoside hydrolase family 55 protein [Planctomycetota bacterium]|jgi:hypothetical protein|nr:glycoside hydrolase family 55 protein [Planctomycetota bacterium]
MLKVTLFAALLCLPVATLMAESITFPPGVVSDLVADYGMVGDGKTDNSEAFQKAVTELKGKNRTLYLPDGVYLISKPVGVFNGKPHSSDRFLTFQGQSQAGTIIKVADNSPAFADPENPAIALCVYEGKSTGDVMHSYVRNLSIDVGAGNPGAIGLRFLTNNTGAIEHVTVRSSDPKGAGFIGLDMRQSQNGPCLVKDVTVEGFAKGVATGNTFSLVFEHLKLLGQSEVGFDCSNARTTIRDLHSTTAAPAIRVRGWGHLSLIEAELTGGAGDASAIEISGKGPRTYLRDVTTTGYAHSVKTRDDKFVDGAIDEWGDGPRYTLISKKDPASLRLPVEETPLVPWENDHGKWVIVDGNKGEDISTKLQQAIDDGASAGATTLYIRGKKLKITAPIRIHGSFNRFIGMSGIIDIADKPGHFKDGANAVFTFDDLKGDTFVVERFFLLGGWDCPTYAVMFKNTSKATMVIKNVNMRGQTKMEQEGGRWFFEDYSPSRQNTLRIGKGEQVWARQFNPESPQNDMIDVNGGQLWLLGLKTEGRATHCVARNGAKVEILGGVSYQSWGKQKVDPPMLKVENATMSASFGLYHSSGHGDPFTIIVEETQGKETKTLGRKELKTYHLHQYRSADAR